MKALDVTHWPPRMSIHAERGGVGGKFELSKRGKSYDPLTKFYLNFSLHIYIQSIYNFQIMAFCARPGGTRAVTHPNELILNSVKRLLGNDRAHCTVSGFPACSRAPPLDFSPSPV